jgi:hypothetical protein
MFAGNRGEVPVSSKLPIQVLLYMARLLFMYGWRIEDPGAGCDMKTANDRIVRGPHSFECRL